ncbi:AAA family ATPase [uncultured Selenomonas sp.]|uniref:AAA family ATPase n=2 Tax=Selenomonas TaxID=970 RepID=UPI0028D4DCF5|nr:AAA family ATPase [uncultured Selenomonas sp.]
MLLKSIKLENFRQFADGQIDFSTDPAQNVTLIIGENGTGKTTFAQAFFWCLYGETTFTDKNLLNRNVSESMTPDQTETVKVVLTLTHGSADYQIIRTQEYKKSYSNKVQGANTVLNISVKSADGNTRYLRPLECETEIKKILPKELSHYFFFDGERIEKMSKEIAAGKRSSSFADAVVGLTGLNGIQEALRHLSPSKWSTSVIGKFNADYVDSDGEVTALTDSIKKLQQELEGIGNEIVACEHEIEAAEHEKKSAEEEIKQYADGARLQYEKERLGKDMILAKTSKGRLVRDVCHAFNAGMTRFFAMCMVQKSMEMVSKSDFGGKDIPELDAKTIQFLLDRGSCLCGTQLMEGSVAYNNLCDLLEYLPPKSIGVTVGAFVKESRQLYAREDDLFGDIGELMGDISRQDENINDLEKEIRLISSKLDGDDMREQVRKLNARIKTCSDRIIKQNMTKNDLLRRQGGAETEKKQKENKRAKLSLLDKNNRHIERCKAYAQRIYEDLFSEYQSKEKEIRENLEISINDIFKAIYDGGLSLSIDDKYNISVYVNDYEGEVETSTAQSISVIFAFISAIIKIARDNCKKIGEESYAEPYPLVMDAPLSAFDKRRIQAICTAIPEAAEQVIIFIKDTDGDLAEEHLGTKVKKRHRFSKIDEFNTKLD